MKNEGNNILKRHRISRRNGAFVESEHQISHKRHVNEQLPKLPSTRTFMVCTECPPAWSDDACNSFSLPVLPFTHHPPSVDDDQDGGEVSFNRCHKEFAASYKAWRHLYLV